MVVNVNSCHLGVSRDFKISQSFFSTRGTTCLSDYRCCWTASTRVGESEKPILSGGRGLFDEISWNGIKLSCSIWLWDKSVIIAFGILWYPLVHVDSFWFHFLSGTATERQSRWNPGAFWRFLRFEMDFLLSRSFQLVTVTIGRYRMLSACFFFW